jgi:hypothetical protein
MWLLKFLPDWIFYVMLFGGLTGLLVNKFVPAIYRTTVQAASAALFVFGLFMAGAIHDNSAWVARVQEMEAKVAAAEVESVKQNAKVVEKVITKVQLIEQRGNDIVKYVDREVTKYDNQCVIPKEFIKAHNDAAEQPK